MKRPKKLALQRIANNDKAPPVNNDEDDLYETPYQRIRVPSDQVRLGLHELKDEHTRVLTANDPTVPNNITKYNYNSRCYKVDPPGAQDHLAIHLSLQGCSVHLAGVEAKDQMSYMQKQAEMSEETLKSFMDERCKSADSVREFEIRKNQFNFSERAVQTFNNPMRERCISTKASAVARFAGTVSQWEMYDQYMYDYTAQVAEGYLERKDWTPTLGGELAVSAHTRNGDMVHSRRMGAALKILERMVSQNGEDEIFNDFKFWEDASDSFREGEGSLLPLWRFHTDRSKRKQVTALSWNPKYSDLFAVGFGSYDFTRQGSGMVCCFSLKNTSHPVYTFTLESGATCLNFHPEHCSLLAVGCYDGVVTVFDVRHSSNRALYESSIKTGKHTDPVWQVQWQLEDLTKDLNFYSISSDGQIANWTMSKNELKMEPVMQLRLICAGKDEPEDTLLSGLANGCCFDFNTVADHLFIVGTEEGTIHKCSKAYSGQYLDTYLGHHMAVYSVRWNPFHSRIFISCSADWTVKIWDHVASTSIMSFDLGNAVGDVSWSPYAATVFAAATSDGKVHVFDLAINKHEPLCEQKVVKRATITRVVFNWKAPILIVGDDRGGVNSFKLSPNLRLSEKFDGVGDASSNRWIREVDSMERIIASVDSNALIGDLMVHTKA